MGFDSFPTPNKRTEKEVSPKKETSRRLRLLVGLEMKLMLGNITTHGREHLKEIPKNKKVIIVPSHLSDLDMQIVINQLGKDFDMAVSGLATNLDMSKDFAAGMSTLLAGRENFLPIDNMREKTSNGDPGVHVKERFNPENFETMADTLRSGKEVLIAGHNRGEGELKKGGKGAVYLAQLGKGDFVILPVAVDIHSKEAMLTEKSGSQLFGMKRPDVDVTILKPVIPEPIPGIEEYTEIVHKRNRGIELQPDEKERMQYFDRILQEQSDTLIMKPIAESLPQEKRGAYRSDVSK